MKRVLLDTNVIVDIATHREPFFEHSSKVFELAVENMIITRNTKDFAKLTGVKILSPFEFLAQV